MKRSELQKQVDEAYKQLTLKQTHAAMCKHYKLLAQLDATQFGTAAPAEQAREAWKKSSESGFTLLEALAAIVIMSIVMWANLAMFGANAKLLAVQSKKITAAAAIIKSAEHLPYCAQFDNRCTGIPKVCFNDIANGKTVQSCNGTCVYLSSTGWTMGSTPCVHGALFTKE